MDLLVQSLKGGELAWRQVFVGHDYEVAVRIGGVVAHREGALQVGADEIVAKRGPGAGEGPTASAVMADVIDLARGLRLPTFGQPAATLATPVAARTATPAPWYLRMTLLDKPGALAKIATCLGEAGVSIDQMRQYGHQGANAPVLIVTHKAARDDIDHAIGRFAGTGVLVGAPVAIRIEEV